MIDTTDFPDHTSVLWHPKEGDPIYVGDMTDLHLENCVKYLDRRIAQDTLIIEAASSALDSMAEQASYLIEDGIEGLGTEICSAIYYRDAMKAEIKRRDL